MNRQHKDVQKHVQDQQETFDKFEEYKLFVEDTAHIANRRQLVTSTYITVNGAVIGLITFISKDIEPISWRLLFITIPLILSGIIICLLWYGLLRAYEKLVGFRYEQFKRIEAEMPESHKMFTLQYMHHRDTHSKNRIGQTRIEKQLPLLFICIYFLISLTIILLML